MVCFKQKLQPINNKKEGLIDLIDETFVNLRNWGDSTVILLSWESTSP